jgi:hypothetical protein
MNSVNRFVPDAAFAIRKASDAAITAATVASAGELVSPIGAPWNDAVKDGKVVVFVGASALDKTTDETYTVQIITSASADLSAPTVSISKVIPANGWYDILVDQVALLKENPAAKYWGVNLLPAGTTPSGKFEVYVLPPVGQ